MQNNEQFVPYGSSCMEYYGYEEEYMPIEAAPQHTDAHFDNHAWLPAPGQWVNEDGKFDAKFSVYTAQAAANLQVHYGKADARPEELQHPSRAIAAEAGHSMQAENTDDIHDMEASEALVGSIAEELNRDIQPMPQVDQSSKTPHLGKAELEQHEGVHQLANADTRNDKERNADEIMEESPWPMQDSVEEEGDSSKSSDKDGLYVVPHMLTPICDLHNNLITSPMCYVVMSKVQPKSFERHLPASASGARSSADDAFALVEQPPQSGVDQGDEEQYWDYAQGNYADYADSLYAASSCGGADDYDCVLDHPDAVDADSKASRESKDDGTPSKASRESKDDDGLASEPGKPRSEVSASARSCPW